MSIYAVKRSSLRQYLFYKLDDDLKHLETYTVDLGPRGAQKCDCPAGLKYCRHKQMIGFSVFKNKDKALIDFDRNKVL